MTRDQPLPNPFRFPRKMPVVPTPPDSVCFLRYNASCIQCHCKFIIWRCFLSFHRLRCFNLLRCIWCLCIRIVDKFPQQKESSWPPENRLRSIQVKEKGKCWLSWTAAPRDCPLDVFPHLKPFSGSNALSSRYSSEWCASGSAWHCTSCRQSSQNRQILSQWAGSRLLSQLGMLAPNRSAFLIVGRPALLNPALRRAPKTLWLAAKAVPLIALFLPTPLYSPKSKENLPYLLQCTRKLSSNSLESCNLRYAVILSAKALRALMRLVRWKHI